MISLHSYEHPCRIDDVCINHVFYTEDLCLIGLNKDYCAWTHTGGAGVSVRRPPGRTKTFFCAVCGGLFATFFHVEGFMLRFSSYEGFYLSHGGLFATFLRGGPFCYVFLLVWGLFHTIWGSFLLFFSPFGGTFLSSCGIVCLYVFLWACPFPL